MNQSEQEILQSIMENTNMGMHSIDVLLDMKKVKESELKNVLEENYADYHEVNNEAAEQLKTAGVEIKQAGEMTKAMGKMGIKMQTVFNSSVSHIADMMIQGSTMGIIDITKELNEHGKNSDSSVTELADKLLHIHQNNVDVMRSYL